MNELACRACRKPLLAREGCSICNPVRRNLVVLNESEDERPSLATVSNEAVNALRTQLKDYRDELKTVGKSDEEIARKGYLQDKQRSVAGALAKLLDAARKLQSDGVDAVERMSFTERAELFVGWYMSLPSAYREQLRDQITKHEDRLLLAVETT